MNHISFLLALLLCLPLSAQQTYRARVVDAETGEALPYVSIHTSSKTETLTNAEGDFAVNAKAKDILTFSLVGYETFRVKADEMQPSVKMVPMQCVEWRDSTRFIGCLLYEALYRFCLGTNKTKESQKVAPYFYRYNISNKRGVYTGEAILKATPACNLREFELIDKRFYNKLEEETAGDWPLYLQRSYINSVLQLGPRPYSVRNWWPLHFWPLKYKCKAKCYELLSTKGKKIYKIRILPQDENPDPEVVDSSHLVTVGDFKYNYSSLVSPRMTEKEKKKLWEESVQELTSEDIYEEVGVMPAPYKYDDYAILTGTLYLNEHWRPLMFEGEVQKYGIEMITRDWVPATCHVRIDYQNRSDYVTVKAAYGTLEYGDVKSRALMLALPDDSISEEEFSSILLRTSEEEQALQEYLNSKE